MNERKENIPLQTLVYIPLCTQKTLDLNSSLDIVLNKDTSNTFVLSLYILKHKPQMLIDKSKKTHNGIGYIKLSSYLTYTIKNNGLKIKCLCEFGIPLLQQL